MPLASKRIGKFFLSFCKQWNFVFFQQTNKNALQVLRKALVCFAQVFCGTKEKFRLFLLSVLPDGRTSAQKLKRRQQQRRQLYTSELAFRFSAKIYFFWFVGVTYLPFLSNLGPPLRSGVALSPGLARLHTIHRFQSCHFPNIHKLFPRPSPKVYRKFSLFNTLHSFISERHHFLMHSCTGNPTPSPLPKKSQK